MSGVIDPGPFNNVEAIINAARQATNPRVIETVGTDITVAVPDNMNVQTIYTEPSLPAPSRRRGRVRLDTAASLIRYVADQRGPGTRLYGSVDELRVVALLDDHWPTMVDGQPLTTIAKSEASPVVIDNDDDMAGWGDHRATLTLRHSPEWRHWAGQDGRLMAQEDFAEHIQDGLDDVLEPDAASFLDLCQTFRATTKANFGSSKMLDSGQTQLTYHQEMTATGGTKSNVVIPATLAIGVPVFDGDAVASRVTAHFRYRLHDGTLRLGYKLKRPHLIIAAAWLEALEGIEKALGLEVLRGHPRGTGEA